eukprot:GFUD01016830.1.p1 GENE.GFUD01016830.1~~GFUD01016830.1.p1  ORF type:complete len:241 (-),score=27.06 GFUD01016830.1:112-834(-)
MVTLNLLIGASSKEVTPEKHVDRMSKNFSSIVLDPKIPKICITSDIIHNGRLSDTYYVQRSHRKCGKNPFYSESHLRPANILRLPGEVSPRSRRALDFSSEPQKCSIPTHGQTQGRARSLSLKLLASEIRNVETVDVKEKMLKCEMCGVTSSSEHKMERHRKLHQTNRKVPKKTVFKCFQCRKTFNQFAKLIIHKYNHPKSLKSNDLCNLCKARFENLSRHHLEVHINSSGNESEEEVVI